MSSPVQECSWMEGNGALNLTKSQIKRRQKALKRKMNANLGSLEKTDPNTGIGISATGGKMPMSSPAGKSSNSEGNDQTKVANGNTASKKRKRKKVKNNNPELGDVLGTRESTKEGLSMTEVLGVKCNESVSGITATLDADTVSKEQDHAKVGNGKTGKSESTDLNVNGKEKWKKNPESKNKKPTLAEILNPQYSQSLEAAKGETDSGTISTDDSASKKQKRQKLNKSLDLGDISSTTKVIEVKGGETVSAKTANMVSKDHTEVENGRTGESETTNLVVNDEAKKKKRKRKAKSKNKQPTLGELLNPQHLQNLEVVRDELNLGKTGEIKEQTVLADTATLDANVVSNEDHTEVFNDKSAESETTNVNVSDKKKKKRKSKKQRPTLGEILNPQYLQNLEAAETGSGTTSTDNTTKVLEVKSDETISGKPATSDANMVSKGDDTEVANGKMQENETINLNVNCKEKKKKRKKPKSKNKVPNLGENLNPQYSQNLEASKVGPQVDNSEMGSTTIVMKSAEPADLKITKVADLGKKLLILDVNGLLADVVTERPKDVLADKYITRRSIFKRPYLDDFLRFCFERFKVGIWSSRVMKNLTPVINFLLGDLKKELLFMWDACKCTDSGIGTLEETYKHVVVKDLRKIWDEDGPKKCWLKGTFNESNTLLVDDSPYKALLNPKHTGIFPASYSYKNRDDNFLGPKGELQTYLEGLAAADDVKRYVEQHPFGQDAIDEQSPHWGFYSSIIGRLNDKSIMESLYKKNQSKRRRCQKDSYHAL